MTSPINNYKQLLELAVLDAHGLLEPIESELFNRSFHDAPASIQDEIIHLQHVFATDESLLPDEALPQSLRQKVLNAVANAADVEAQRLAPLALIGARANAARGQYGSTRSTTLWRTVAMVLFGVAIIFAITTVDAERRVTEYENVLANRDANDTLSILASSDFSKFINNPYCSVFRLERTQGDPVGYIRVAIHELTGEGFVLGIDLIDGDDIIIQGTTSDGSVIDLVRITPSGPVAGRTFSIDPSLLQGLIITAIDAKTGVRWI